MAMPEYQQRVIHEKNELNYKLLKLCKFFSTDVFNSLPEDEKDRLHRQAKYMAEYIGVLNERIFNFPQGNAE